MRGVDHDPLRFAALARQFGENLVEHAQATPANEPIVDRLVRAIVGRSVAPTQPVLDHEHDRADDPPIVHPRDPMRERKIPLNPTHLNPRQQKQISHGEASQPPPMNQPIRTPARTLIGPEPSLGIDSKLRACDLLKLKVRDLCHGERVAARAIVVQQKTSRPVQFEITESTRSALAEWIRLSGLASDDFLFPSRVHTSTRQYARIVDSWVEEIGLDPTANGTHSIRRTKPSLIYRRTKNLRAVQLPLGHTKLESTVRYLGIEVEAYRSRGVIR